MLITLLHAGAGAALAAWASAHAGSLSASVAPAEFWPAVVGTASAMALLGGVLSRWALPASPARLRWDGQGWQLLAGSRLPPPTGTAQPVAATGQPLSGAPQPLRRVVVSLDLGGWLLLHLLPANANANAKANVNGAGQAGRGVWRVASARGAGAAWHGLRVALLAHAGAAAPAAAPTDRPS